MRLKYSCFESSRLIADSMKGILIVVAIYGERRSLDALTYCTVAVDSPRTVNIRPMEPPCSVQWRVDSV